MCPVHRTKRYHVLSWFVVMAALLAGMGSCLNDDGAPGIRSDVRNSNVLPDQQTFSDGTQRVDQGTKGGPSGGPINGSITVTVVENETGAPISGAFVMVGDGPESGDWNWGTTNGSGVITIAQTGLSGPITVTAGDGSHSWMTLFQLDAANVVIPLGARDRNTSNVTMTGDVSGISFSNGDSYYDVGIVVEPLRFSSLLTFNFEELMAPYKQRCFDIPGGTECFDLPGNLYAPNQWERFFIIFKMYLEMTPYYVPVEVGVSHRLGAMVGRVHKDTLLSLVSNPNIEFSEIAAMIDLRQVGVSNFFTPSSPYVQNFAVTNTVSETLTAHVANFPADSDVFCAALADLDSLSGGGEMLISDFNSFEGGGTPTNFGLKTIVPGGPITAYSSLCGSIALGQSDTPVDGAISAQIDRDGSASAYMETPFAFLTGLFQSDRTFSFSDPTTGWSPNADLVRGDLYIVETGTGDREYFWEFTAPGGETQITLPDLPSGITPPSRDPLAGERIDFELSATAMTFGTPFTYDAFDFDTLEDGITHLAFRTFRGFENPYPSCTVSADCDDGIFCNGAEICSPVTSQCEEGTPPCEQGEFCNESSDTCDPFSICLEITDACLEFYLLIDPQAGMWIGSAQSCTRGIFPAYAKLVPGGWLVYLDYDSQGIPPDCHAGDFALIRGQGTTAAVMQWIDCVQSGPTPLTAGLCDKETNHGFLQSGEPMSSTDWEADVKCFWD